MTRTVRKMVRAMAFHCRAPFANSELKETESFCQASTYTPYSAEYTNPPPRMPTNAIPTRLIVARTISMGKMAGSVIAPKIFPVNIRVANNLRRPCPASKLRNATAAIVTTDCSIVDSPVPSMVGTISIGCRLQIQ